MKRLKVSNSEEVLRLERLVIQAEQDFLEASKEYYAARLKLAHALQAEKCGRSGNFRLVKEGSTLKRTFDYRSYAAENGISEKVINRYMRHTHHNRRLSVVRVSKAEVNS